MGHALCRLTRGLAAAEERREAVPKRGLLTPHGRSQLVPFRLPDEIVVPLTSEQEASLGVIHHAYWTAQEAVIFPTSYDSSSRPS